MGENKEPKGSAAWLDGTDDSVPTQSAAPAPVQQEPVKDTQEWTEQQNGVGESKATPASDHTQTADMPKPADGEKSADNPAGVSAQNTTNPDIMGLDQQIQLVKDTAAKYKQETDEERKKREKKEKRDKMWAAIGDGLQSLSNLFFTTKGAPNMYEHKTMSHQTPLQKRLEEAKAERKAKDDEYFNLQLKLGDLYNKRAATVREIEAQQEARKLAREKAKREDEKQGWERIMQPFLQQQAQEKANKAASDAITAGEEAKNAGDYYKAKVNTEKARGRAADASAGASSASAAYSRAKGAAVNPYKVYNKGTKCYEYFPTKDSAITAAQQYGTAVEVEGGSKTSTSTAPVKNSRGKVTGTATTTSTSTTKNVIPASKETIEGTTPAPQKPAGKKKTGVNWG